MHWPWGQASDHSRQALASMGDSDMAKVTSGEKGAWEAEEVALSRELRKGEAPMQIRSQNGQLVPWEELEKSQTCGVSSRPESKLVRPGQNK